MDGTNTVNVTVDVLTLCERWRLTKPERWEYKFSVYIYLLIYLPASVLGIACNIFTIAVLRNLQTTSKCYYTVRVLAVCDLLFMIAAFVLYPLRSLYVFAVLGDIVFRLDDWNFGHGFILPALPCFYIFQMIRNWIVVVLSLERLLVVTFPLRSLNFWTDRTVDFVVSLIAVCAVLGYAVYFMPNKLPAILGCPRTWPFVLRGYQKPAPLQLGDTLHYEWYFVVAEVYMFLYGTVLVPMCSLVAINLLLTAAVIHQKQKRKNIAASSNWVREQKVLRMVFAVVLVYILCEGVGFLDRMHYYGYIHLKVNTMVLRKISLAFSIVDSSVNFFIYVFTNRKFKSEALRLISRKQK